MTDDLGLFEERPSRERPRRPTAASAAARRAKQLRKKRRNRLAVFGIVVALLIGGGVWFGFRQLSGLGGYDDFSGAGERDVIFEVKGGDSTGAIAGRLAEDGIVASGKAFLAAAQKETKVRSIQPGYYVMRTKISGEAAVQKIVTPTSKVGHLQIRAGTQLDDLANGATVVPGIISQLSAASCATLDGKKTCVPVEELLKVAETGDLKALGVPEWAIPDASRAPEPKRRLEGLIAPDVYDVKPGSTAEELWTKLVTESSARLQSYGMPKLAESTGFTPYQVLVIASLIEREAIEADFKKVSRVTYNRLVKAMELKYDSTINYVLTRPAITTRAEDRATPGPYNSYLNTGLTPTPIAAASKAALAAAANPAEGTWLFFVKCQKNGTSCFGDTYAQHEDNIKQAKANGAY
ncbi:endolytic transglycosylase MltG [Actinokineospora xionganensis]|uniref:Endolytic murein transglycosylase n=1 Tax=Actinokineospora xionganensis TaxID=2684470 RepID=A0ABR7L7E8_9PSEU|nr:endolytic transglycosylase MltG [Actinokineospora xionganensis]MBC6448569.1 endolytic transglycosylase MltG [Actinokineospora xionganensis]